MNIIDKEKLRELVNNNTEEKEPLINRLKELKNFGEDLVEEVKKLEEKLKTKKY